MNDKEESEGFSLIPDGERKCIWMKAGLISYKICDRNMDCEHCPLDRALRGDRAGDSLEPDLVRDVRVTPPQDAFSRFKMDSRRFYHAGHTWVEVEAPDRARVGIDDFLANILGSLDGVNLVKAGEETVSCTPFGDLHQDTWSFSMLSPLTGTVLESNREVLSAPTRLLRNPLAEGWLIRVKPLELDRDLESCRTGGTVFSWYLREMDWIHSVISTVLEEHRERLGPTLHDGGRMTRNLRKLLPRDQYRRLVLRLLSAREAGS